MRVCVRVCVCVCVQVLNDWCAGGLADLRKSLEQGLGVPVSHPTLEILLNEQAGLKVGLRYNAQYIKPTG